MRGGLAVAFLLTVVLLLMAAPASAEVSGGCTAQITSSGPNTTPVDVGTHDSNNKPRAVKVHWEGSLTASATAPQAAGAYRVFLEYWGFKWQIAEGTTNDNTWSTTKSIKPFAIYGTGFYKVLGETPSVPCTGAALVEIIGKKPLATAAGLTSMGLSIIGIGGMVITSIACGFGRGMGIPKQHIATPGRYETNYEVQERTTPGGYERFVDSWQDVKTPGGYVSWCGTAARHTPPPIIRNICGNHTFQERMADVCRG